MSEYDSLQAYLKHLYSTNEIKSKLHDLSRARGTIVTRFNDLQLITDISKKLPVISETCVLFENMQNEGTMKTVHIASSFEHSSSRVTTYQDVEFVTLDLKRIEEWFNLSKEMLRRGRVVYVPNLRIQNKTVSEDEYGVVEPSQFHKYETCNYLDAQEYFQAVPDAGVFVNDLNAIPLFNFEIPGFENISPTQLSKVMDDHPEQLHRFKNYIQRKLLDFKGTLGSEGFSREIRRVELDIDDGLLKLREDYKKLSKTTAIDILGAQAITWTLHVLVFMQQPNELLKAVLPGGAVAALSSAYARYLKEKMDLGSNPLEFLLLVSRNVKKL